MYTMQLYTIIEKCQGLCMTAINRLTRDKSGVYEIEGVYYKSKRDALAGEGVSCFFTASDLRA
ncbi:hypothetical protein KSC_091740 [Ktedonobacter sp. SOSP1-52]|nr:hypothetical protein KSC_091740 [Ktedonobacter sp. SOSP1-52]